MSVTWLLTWPLSLSVPVVGCAPFLWGVTVPRSWLFGWFPSSWQDIVGQYGYCDSALKLVRYLADKVLVSLVCMRSNAFSTSSLEVSSFRVFRTSESWFLWQNRLSLGCLSLTGISLTGSGHVRFRVWHGT